MDALIARQLIELNRQFYQTFALQFSQTRRRIQPGVRQVLNTIPRSASILDLGCGNGELWQSLQKAGFNGDYLGVDSSSGLLDIARARDFTESPKKPVFIYADLTEQTWDSTLTNDKSIKIGEGETIHFDIVLAFAVLHHIPTASWRIDILKKIRGLIQPDGLFIHSEWQFINSDKLKQRIQPWSAIGLQDSNVDDGDYLLDWRHGGQGWRYIHLFQEDELQILANLTDFEIQAAFYSDGQGGNLSLYQTWSAVK